MSVRPVLFYKTVEPGKQVLNIKDAEGAILSVARTIMELADVIAKREQMATQLETRIAEEVKRWGIEITSEESASIIKSLRSWVNQPG